MNLKATASTAARIGIRKPVGSTPVPVRLRKLGSTTTATIRCDSSVDGMIPVSRTRSWNGSAASPATALPRRVPSFLPLKSQSTFRLWPIRIFWCLTVWMNIKVEPDIGAVILLMTLSAELWHHGGLKIKAVANERARMREGDNISLYSKTGRCKITERNAVVFKWAEYVSPARIYESKPTSDLKVIRSNQ